MRSIAPVAKAANKTDITTALEIWGRIMPQLGGATRQLQRTTLTHPAKGAAAKEIDMLSTVLILLLILLLVGALPNWGYSADWGYGPGGAVGTVLAIVIVLALLGRI